MILNLETALSTWKHDGKLTTGQNLGKSQLGNISFKPHTYENIIISFETPIDLET